MVLRSTSVKAFGLLAVLAAACGPGDETVPMGGTGGLASGGSGLTGVGASGGGAGLPVGAGGSASGGFGAGPSFGGTVSAGGSGATGAVPGATGAVPGIGGAVSSGGVGAGGPVTGGTSSTGGTFSSGGFSTGATGGFNTTGGVTSSGGATSTGGVPSTGGIPSTGGTSTGGVPSTGGVSTGGTSTGGTSTGGTSTGGVSTGGSGTCEYPEPPSTVAAWVEESWNAELGNNVRGREAWLLDSAIMGQGQINVCVRWGATSAPSGDVKSGMESNVANWLNDWFTAIGTYGCFPYPNGVTVKVTGWAVRPGNESWVSDLGSSVGVYTETDGEGEPKCPDSCSFFVNWDHQFPDCPGGEAFHHDYWVWLDDELPGGGAAAVGGDWGFRMPVRSFLDAMGQDSLVIEHEMGHGFGLQDYYTWNGSTPAGGSLMIVGSTNQQSPTEGDTWLIRRTWKEQQALRGW